MSEESEVVPADAPVALAVVKFDVTESQIAEARERLSQLTTCTTPAEYRAVSKAIGECVDTRVGIETQRKALKRAALEYGRRLDARAKHLTALIEPIEQPLRQLKAQYDEEKDRERKAKEEAERAALEAQVRQAREAEEARLRAIREAEEKRLADERKRLEVERKGREWLTFVGFLVMLGVNAEGEERKRVAEAEERARRAADETRLAEERAKADAEARARREAEERRLAEERAALDAARERVRREEAEAAAREAARVAAAETEKRLARERAEAEEAQRQEEARRLEHARRMEALRPDRVKLAAYATALYNVEKPAVDEPEAIAALMTASRFLQQAIAALDALGEAWEREQVADEDGT